MAKSIGLVGTLSGKSGNFVFCKGADGRTIVRPYQPQVYNPKTAGQSSQRAKMVLAGMLSSVTPSSLLVCMGAGRKVANRAAFVQNLLRKADTSLILGAYQATVLGEDIIFARGIAPMRCSIGRPVLSQTKVTVSVTPQVTSDLVGMCGVRLVALVADKLGGGQNFREVSFVDVVFESTSVAQSVDIPVSELTSGESVVAVYAIPFDMKTDAVSQFAEDNGYLEDPYPLLAANLRTSSSLIKDWGDSHIIDDFITFRV